MISCEKQYLSLIKMQNYPQLLRRPLPPKLPELPLSKRVPTARTDELKPRRRVKFTRDKGTLMKRDATRFPDILSGKQPPSPVTIQTLSLDYHLQTRVATIRTPPKSSKNVHWSIPETATGFIFFPSCHSACSRIFGKEAKLRGRSRIAKGPPKLKEIAVDSILEDILILSSQFSKPFTTPSPVLPRRPQGPPSRLLHALKSRTYTFKPSLMDESAEGPMPLIRGLTTQAKAQKYDLVQKNATVLLNITYFPGPLFIPEPVLPRKPQRQHMIETLAKEYELSESSPTHDGPDIHEGLLKTRKQSTREAKAVHGEPVRMVATTQYETVEAMASLAVVNCHIHGRNALNLKGFFILNCPDLTSLAYQLIYLNLSFNDISSFPTEVFCLKYLQVLILRNNPIKSIPSGIQQLRSLRVFNIAFNLVMTLPPGLFYLPHLEELNISYNSIAFIPNDIQKLRSLKILIVDGNDLTSFPPEILKLNLKRIQFENNFTYPCLWRENSLNSPQRLTHITSLFFLKNNLQNYYEEIPAKVQMLLKCTSRCEWCQGPRFGEGYRVIQSCHVFGVTHLPVMFQVCSSPCYRAVHERSVL